jgi:hypothetical protein
MRSEISRWRLGSNHALPSLAIFQVLDTAFQWTVILKYPTLHSQAVPIFDEQLERFQPDHFVGVAQLLLKLENQAFNIVR